MYMRIPYVAMRIGFLVYLRNSTVDEQERPLSKRDCWRSIGLHKLPHHNRLMKSKRSSL